MLTQAPPFSHSSARLPRAHSFTSSSQLQEFKKRQRLGQKKLHKCITATPQKDRAQSQVITSNYHVIT